MSIRAHISFPLKWHLNDSSVQGQILSGRVGATDRFRFFQPDSPQNSARHLPVPRQCGSRSDRTDHKTYAKRAIGVRSQRSRGFCASES